MGLLACTINYVKGVEGNFMAEGDDWGVMVTRVGVTTSSKGRLMDPELRERQKW